MLRICWNGHVSFWLLPSLNIPLLCPKSFFKKSKLTNLVLLVPSHAFVLTTFHRTRLFRLPRLMSRRESLFSKILIWYEFRTFHLLRVQAVGSLLNNLRLLKDRAQHSFRSFWFHAFLVWKACRNSWSGRVRKRGKNFSYWILINFKLFKLTSNLKSTSWINWDCYGLAVCYQSLKMFPLFS